MLVLYDYIREYSLSLQQEAAGEGGDVSQTAQINNALDILRKYSQTDGAHHKAWCLDQIARALLENDFDYDEFIAEVGEWDVGIAP